MATGPMSSESSPVERSSLSPSPGPSSGRPRRSPVWKFFEYDKAVDKSICQISTESDSSKLCGQAIAGKYPTNLKQHLNKHHPVQYASLLQLEKEQELLKLHEEKIKKQFEMKPNPGQMTLQQSLKGKKEYDKESDRYKLIIRKLAIFVGCTNVPNRIVESPEFRDLLITLDRRFVAPGRASISKELDKVMADLKAKIVNALKDSQRVSICADIWTKKGMSSSYLGITAHFFTHSDHVCHRVTLAVRRMPSPHTGENIRQLVDHILTEWDIPLQKVAAVITDNGSNMLAAFKTHFESESDDDDGLVGEDEEPTYSYEEEEKEFEDYEDEHDDAFGGYTRVSSLLIPSN